MQMSLITTHEARLILLPMSRYLPLRRETQPARPFGVFKRHPETAPLYGETSVLRRDVLR